MAFLPYNHNIQESPLFQLCMSLLFFIDVRGILYARSFKKRLLCNIKDLFASWLEMMVS